MAGDLHTSNNEKSKNQEERAKLGIHTGIIGVIVNVILVIIKLTAGLLVGSVSILADAMNNLGDSAGAILTIAGFRISNRPPDKEHPFGHQRAEYISGLFVAVIILVVGFQFLLESISKIINPTAVDSSVTVIILLILSVLLKLGLGVYYRTQSNRLSSSTLNTLKKDSINDSIMTLAVILSYIIEIQFNWYIDGYVGLVIALIIIYSGFTSVMESSDTLLGTRPDDELIDAMQEILNSYQSLIGYHDLIVHRYGPNKIFATVDIEIESSWSLNEAHDLMDHIEKNFENQLSVVLVGHLDPVQLEDDRQNEIHALIKRTLKSYDQDFHFHDFSIEETEDNSIIYLDIVVPESIKATDKEIYEQFSADINKEISGYKIFIKFDRNYLLK